MIRRIAKALFRPVYRYLIEPAFRPLERKLRIAFADVCAQEIGQRLDQIQFQLASFGDRLLLFGGQADDVRQSLQSLTSDLARLQQLHGQQQERWEVVEALAEETDRLLLAFLRTSRITTRPLPFVPDVREAA
jgi:hypothetical protein